ncbi:MAG: phosphoribosyltransferase [Betaproteobacteria bacterium]
MSRQQHDNGAGGPDEAGFLPYRDRWQAADRLADALVHHRGRQALVLAIPRGAVPMSLRVAERLEAALDVVPVRKVGAPGQPELAIGAVDGDGVLVRTPGLEAVADDAWLSQETERQRALLAKRFALYRERHPAIDPQGRCVIVIDDGLATGATMRAALGWVRPRHPPRGWCARCPWPSLSRSMRWACSLTRQCARCERVSSFRSHSFICGFPR